MLLPYFYDRILDLFYCKFYAFFFYSERIEVLKSVL